MNAVPPDAVIDDDDELVGCYRHPARMTALHCITCDKPICIDCAVIAAVGQKCPDCARLPKTARATVPTLALVRAGATGLVLGSTAGFVYWHLSLPFIGWILAGVVGGAIGEAVRRASGGFRGPAIAMLAGATVAFGFAWPLALQLIQHGSVGAGTALNLVGALFAAVAAVQRAS